MAKRSILISIFVLMATLCHADTYVSFEADADAAGAELFLDGTPGASLVVGTAKACDHIKSALTKAEREKITILFSDEEFTHFFDGQCVGKCDLIQLSNLSVQCKNQSDGKACMPYAGVLGDKIYTLSFDPTVTSIQEACFK